MSRDQLDPVISYSLFVQEARRR